MPYSAPPKFPNCQKCTCMHMHMQLKIHLVSQIPLSYIRAHKSQNYRLVGKKGVYSIDEYIIF